MATELFPDLSRRRSTLDTGSRRNNINKAQKETTSKAQYIKT